MTSAYYSQWYDLDESDVNDREEHEDVDFDIEENILCNQGCPHCVNGCNYCLCL